MATTQTLKSGDIDPSFGENGFLTVMPPGNFSNNFTQLTRNSKNETLIYGNYIRQTPLTPQVGVARVTEDGQIDDNFGDLDDGFSTAPTEIATGNVTGLSFREDDGFHICYITQGLTPIVSYDKNGKLLERPDFIEGQIDSHPLMLETTNDKFLVVGKDSRTATLYRRNQDGSADTSFGEEGMVRLLVDAQYTAIWHMAQQTGRASIYLSGEVGNDGFIARLTEHGQPDESFAEAGVHIFNALGGQFGSCRKFTELENGKILALITSIVLQGVELCTVCRLNESGSTDTDFNAGRDLVVAAARAEDMAVQADDKFIVLCRSIVNGNQLMRFLPDGTLDNDFGSNGTVFLNQELIGFAKSLLIQPDGKIIVGATSGSGTVILRLLP